MLILETQILFEFFKAFPILNKVKFKRNTGDDSHSISLIIEVRSLSKTYPISSQKPLSFLTKIIQVDDNSENVEINYFDENVVKIESRASAFISKGSILCSFSTIYHNTEEFKLSDGFQGKLIQQVAEERHLLCRI